MALHIDGARKAMSGIDGFSDFIRELGFDPPARIEPGCFVRFSSNGKHGDSAGYARLFPDCEGGIVGDWRSGESWTWQVKRERPQSALEAQAWREKCERSKREAHAERERESKQTADRAQDLWRISKSAEESHPLLTPAES